jgi:hypothetical protein
VLDVETIADEQIGTAEHELLMAERSTALREAFTPPAPRLPAADRHAHPGPLCCAKSSLIATDLGSSRRLGCPAVFADQAAEDLRSLDPGPDIDDLAGPAQRRFVLQALVRPVAVIVPGVLV